MPVMEIGTEDCLGFQVGLQRRQLCSGLYVCVCVYMCMYVYMCTCVCVYMCGDVCINYDYA